MFNQLVFKHFVFRVYLFNTTHMYRNKLRKPIALVSSTMLMVSIDRESDSYAYYSKDMDGEAKFVSFCTRMVTVLKYRWNHELQPNVTRTS